jgi:hypothetical protein
LAKVLSVRHSAGLKGGFLIVDDKDYCGFVSPEDSQPRIQLFPFTSESFVAQQGFLFETLWTKAVPFEQRVREIEQGIPIETTEVVQGVENILRKCRLMRAAIILFLPLWSRASQCGICV